MIGLKLKHGLAVPNRPGEAADAAIAPDVLGGMLARLKSADPSLYDQVMRSAGIDVSAVRRISESGIADAVIRALEEREARREPGFGEPPPKKTPRAPQAPEAPEAPARTSAPCACGAAIAGGPTSPCKLAAEGRSAFGVGVITDAATTETEVTAKPKRAVSIRNLHLAGTNLASWVLTHFDIDGMPLTHGGGLPASIFDPEADLVDFDIVIGTNNQVSIKAKSILADIPADQAGRLFVSFATAFPGSAYYEPVAQAVREQASKVLLLGLGTASGAQGGAAGTKLSEDPPDRCTLGALVLDAVFSAASGPDVITEQGYTARKGSRALDYVQVDEVSINGVDILTTLGTSGALSGREFSAKAKKPFVINLPADAGKYLEVKWTNKAPAAATTANDNQITVCGGVVGCQVTR